MLIDINPPTPPLLSIPRIHEVAHAEIYYRDVVLETGCRSGILLLLGEIAFRFEREKRIEERGERGKESFKQFIDDIERSRR